MKIRKKRLEDAIKYIFSHNGGLVEPQAAWCDHVFAYGE